MKMATILIIYQVMLLVLLIIVSESTQAIQDTTNGSSCNVTVLPVSKRYYESRLTSLKPHFVHINLNVNTSYTSLPNVFQPLHWVWTYSTPSTIYPYLSLPTDHGLLSFGLLDVKTISIPQLYLQVSDNCHLIFGEENTTENIASALTTLLMDMQEQSFQKYELGYFCYYSLDSDLKHTAEYTAAVYLSYPIQYLNYRCCSEHYDYLMNQYNQTCETVDHGTWTQCRLGPYVLSLAFFVYFPIVLLRGIAWISDDETIRVREEQFEMSDGYEPLEGNETKWTYLNGTPPITFLDVLNIPSCLVDGNKYPHIKSRIRRSVISFLCTILIYIELGMYNNGIGYQSIQIKELVKNGVPVGFLNLLADRMDRGKTFATAFGGPMCILMMYYILSIVFIVLPTSTKRIFDRGIPEGSGLSALWLGKDEIIELSMYHMNPKPGYETGYVICKGGMFMLFSRSFWKRVFYIQMNRINLSPFDRRVFNFALKLCILPLYVVVCSLEIVLCLILYGIPFIGMSTIAIRGAVKTLCHRQRGRSGTHVFSNPLIMFFVAVVGIAMFLFYAYTVCLIFIQSFSFLSQILFYCFVAIVIYPTYAFGYLFFVAVLLYYLIHLMKDFGDGYLELLSIAVEKSHKLENHVNNLTLFDSHLIISNVRTRQIKSIRVNDVHVEIPQNILQAISGHNQLERMSEVDQLYGVPTRLFEYLVRKHRPVHIQALKVIFHLTCIMILIGIALSITSNVTTGVTSEVSDVMHAIFLITVGALPHVVEVGLINTGETVKREVEMRRIEHSIKEFWFHETEGQLLSDSNMV